MSTAEDLRELARQTRVRLATVDHLRGEHRRIEAQTLRSLDESRALLDRPSWSTATGRGKIGPG